jgi:hypothetical protein
MLDSGKESSRGMDGGMESLRETREIVMIEEIARIKEIVSRL